MEEKKLPHDHGQSMERELEQLEGTVEDIIYENADNGYTVFEVSGGASSGCCATVRSASSTSPPWWR